jgi:RNA polymerase sigma-70 factor, ECF subfamily
MGAQAQSTLRPRDPVERVTPPHLETTMSFSGRATPAPVKEPCRCVVSARSTFDEVLACYQDAIYRYALHLTRNRVDADEVYQDTVLKAYLEFDRLGGSVNHRAWLYQIMTNTFLSSSRRRSKEGSSGGESARFFPAATSVRLKTPTLLAEVETCLVNLPVQQRLALIQRMYHDLSYAEIAACLRCPEVTARARVNQALRTLRGIFWERT